MQYLCLLLVVYFSIGQAVTFYVLTAFIRVILGIFILITRAFGAVRSLGIKPETVIMKTLTLKPNRSQIVARVISSTLI